MSNPAERLYDQFQKEQQSLHRWLLAALLLGIFYGFVFQPYLALLSDLAYLEITQVEAKERLNTTESEIQTATGAIERAIRFMGDASEYQRLYDDAQSWVDTVDELEQQYDLQSRKVASLRDALSASDQAKWPAGTVPNHEIIWLLRKSRPEFMENFQTGDNCFFRTEIDWIRCLVDQKRRPIKDRLFRVLYDRTSAHVYTALLEQEIQANDAKYQASLPKALSQAGLKKWVKEYLGEEQAIIRRWYEHMAHKRSELVRQSRLYQEALEEHKLAEAKLDRRKQEFSHTGEVSTPIGPVTLALHDILASVPFVGLFILSMLVKSTNRQLLIRSAFHKYATEDETTRDVLSLAMPVWLEPYQHRIVKLVFLGGLALVAIITLYGLWQIINNPGLEVAQVNLNSHFIIAMTVLAACVFTFLFIQLVINIFAD